jgi:hypothetical protein
MTIQAFEIFQTFLGYDPSLCHPTQGSHYVSVHGNTEQADTGMLAIGFHVHT